MGSQGLVTGTRWSLRLLAQAPTTGHVMWTRSLGEEGPKQVTRSFPNLFLLQRVDRNEAGAPATKAQPLLWFCGLRTSQRDPEPKARP